MYAHKHDMQNILCVKVDREVIPIKNSQSEL